MKTPILALLILSLPALAHAADYICFDGEREVPVMGIKDPAMLKRLPFTGCREVAKPKTPDLSRKMGKRVRAELLATAARFPDTLHSYQGFPFVDPPRRIGDLEFRNFSEATPLGDLLDDQGRIILFRVIGQHYCPGYVQGTQFVTNEGNAYSYSLTPGIAKIWGSAEADAQILLALQAPADDDLRSPIFVRENGESRLQMGPLEKDLLVKNIANFEEVKVPVKKERVVAVIKQKSFQDILAGFGRRPFTLRELMERLTKSPDLRLPAESCPGI